MFNSGEFSAPPFWENGPSPGALYSFPARKSQTPDFRQHSQTAITTATSIVACTFNHGVIIGADLLGSYGSLARFRDCPRIYTVNENTILAAGGDYGDFQYVKDLVKQKIIDEECLDDGFTLKPKSLHCWLTRIMYNRRCKLDPFLADFIVAGLQDGVPYLATVDKLGTAYEDKAICTGFGAHLALPNIRSALQKNPNPSETEARALVNKSMEVLYYRDARSFSKYQVGVITKAGVKIEGPIAVTQKWDLANIH